MAEIRFRRTSRETLVNEITIDDPVAYTRPWTATMNYRLRQDFEMGEFICNELDAVGPPRHAAGSMNGPASAAAPSRGSARHRAGRYVFVKPFRAFETTNVPSCSTASLIQ